MTSAQDEINSNVHEMAATIDDKYETIEEEISEIRSAKNGSTSQIRQINVSYVYKILLR